VLAVAALLGARGGGTASGKTAVTVHEDVLGAQLIPEFLSDRLSTSPPPSPAVVGARGG
jgi:hypothetical protein